MAKKPTPDSEKNAKNPHLFPISADMIQGGAAVHSRTPPKIGRGLETPPDGAISGRG
jgi:hypothetical protein